MAIEETGSFHGIYHVLGGIISPMDGIGPADLNIPSLLEKINSGNVKEVIFALSATMEGDTTNFFLYKKIQPFGITVTTLSRGVSVGSELQYADGLTLGRSIINRTLFRVD
jgi:recombination protein RecR